MLGQRVQRYEAGDPTAGTAAQPDRHRRLSRRLPPGRRGSRAHLSFLPSSGLCTEAPQNPGGRCTVHGPGPRQQRPAPHLCPAGLCAELRHHLPAPASGLLAKLVSVGSPGQEKTHSQMHRGRQAVSPASQADTRLVLPGQVSRAPPGSGSASPPALTFPLYGSGKEVGAGRDPDAHPFL